MKGDDSWVVIGVLTILMVDSGQSYYYNCNADIFFSITGAESYVKPSYMPNFVKDMHDDIVATTSNYFDKLTAKIEDPKTFVCASMYKKPEDERNEKVIFNVKYRKDDNIVDYTLQPVLAEANRGSFFPNCVECPDIVVGSYGYRFYSKGGVSGVYTCNWSISRGNAKTEGFIKASFSLTRNADGTGKKELSPETKALIEEARAKAKELEIDISENVPFGCNTEPPRADPPPTKAYPTEVSPTQVSPTQVSHTQASPTEVSPTQVSPTQVSHTQASPTEVSPTQVSPTQASPTQVSPTQASPTQVSPTQVSPTQVSPTQVSHTERSPANVSPASAALVHKYGIAMIILTIGGFALLYGTR